MTNGEKILQTFPHSKTETHGIITKFIIDGYSYEFSTSWWNAEYKEPTLNASECKLEDCISRQALLDATVKKNSIWNTVTNSEGDNLETIISKLPSVLPKAKTSKWKKETIKKITKNNFTIYDPKWICSECGQEYDGGIANSIIKYCFKCGCKMEVEDGNDN